MMRSSTVPELVSADMGSHPARRPASGRHTMLSGRSAEVNAWRFEQMDGPAARSWLRSATPNLSQQAKHFQVEPDQRHHHAKCAVPFHVFRGVRLNARLNEVKIENQIERRDDDDEKAYRHSQRPDLIQQRNAQPEEAQNKIDEEDHHDSPRR